MNCEAADTARGSRTAVFVYGTLKRGGENHALLARQRFLGSARTSAGYRLYALDGYPGMIKDATAAGGVSGEVWEVDADTLRALDELEGVDEGLYARERVHLQPPFDHAPVETYLYLRSVAGRADLNGEWPIP